jgi:hypothetical protein
MLMSSQGIILNDDVPPGYIRVAVVEGRSIPEWPYFIESPSQVNASMAMGSQIVPIGSSCFGSSKVK